MPIHDWARVGAGIFHDFHNAWITELRNALNSGLLPSDYYALAEQLAGTLGPDVLTLQANGVSQEPPGSPVGTLTVTKAPPRVRMVTHQESQYLRTRRKTLVIRHSSKDRVVAMIEIASPGNKASAHALRSFVAKAVAALSQGIHLLLVDLHPPTRRDPQGIHGAIWEEWAGEEYAAPPDKPLTLTAYSAGPPVTGYIEPIAVGDMLMDMPLFLTAEEYVPVPLEATYALAYRGVPLRWRQVLEAA